MAVISIQRDTNNNVSLVRIISTDTIATVSSINYIANQQYNINAINGGYFSWFTSDIIVIAASDSNGFFVFTDNNFTSLVPIASGTVSPGLANEVAYYPMDGSSVSGLTTIANGILATNSLSVPAIVTTLPSQVQTNITKLGTITQGVWNGTPITVSYGGTGNTTFTAYSVLCAGITATAPFQNVSGLGTLNYVLTSNGNGALPTWQVSQGVGTVQPGTINDLAFYTATGSSVGPLSTANSGVLITSGLGVPSISSTLPTTVQGNITQLGTQSQALNMGSHQINNVADPTHAQDAATMNYVSNIAGGLNPIAGVYAASTANLTGYTYNNGSSGIGATLTAGSTGTFALDSVSPPVSSRILYKDDSTYSGVANGIYVVTTSAGGSDAVLTRWTGYDTPNQIHVGDLLSVENGTINGGSAWYQTDVVGTIGTDPLAFSIWFNPASYVSSSLAQNKVFIGNASNIASASTASYLNTTTINQILYSSSNNVIAGLSSANSGVLVTSGSGVPSILTAGTTGQVLQASSSGTPAWSTPTYPIASGSTGVILRSNGTNNVYTTSTFSDTYAASTILYSNGANTVTGLATANNGTLVTSNTGVPSILAGPGSTGNILQSNSALAPSWSTAQYPSVATSTGTILRANGTNWVPTTSTFADTYVQNTLLFAGTANIIAGATLTSIIDTALGSTQGDILYRNSTVWTVLAPGTSGQILQTGGAAANPAWTTSTFPTTGGAAGNVLISNGTNYIASTSLWPNTVGNSGLFLISNGTTNTYSSSTIPTSAGATANKVLLSDGTNYVLSTPTFPNASATAGKLTISDGTNWIASTPTYPNTSGSAGQLLVSNGTNIVFSTPTYPNASTTAGKIIISDGTNYVASTPTYPNTAGTAYNVLQSDGTNITSTTLTSVIDGAIGSTQGSILYRGASVWAALTPGTSGYFLKTQGASANPVWALPSGSGTVNSGTAGQLAYYATSTNAVSGGQLGNVLGTATNDNAAAGNVGEFITINVPAGSPVTFSNNASHDLTSISLTAGDWDVWGNIAIASNSGDQNRLLVWISITSATLPDFSLFNGVNFSSATMASLGGFSAPQIRLSLSGTTTVYLSGNQTSIGAGSISCCGTLSARRAR